MKVIDDFLEQYNRQYDFYSYIANIGCAKLEDALNKKGIKAIVSNRAKKPERLRSKLIQRHQKKPYKDVNSIFDDIVDLAGVRVALYFPSDRDLVDQTVADLFKVNKKKVFPDASFKPDHTKRFSGYWATHYRVEVKPDDDKNKRYQNTQFEIQVASVLMHAWAEVEHDMVYKPLSGNLSEEELSILDEINGLVLSGEIALERLQKAMTKRTLESKQISDKYELTGLIVNSLNKNYINKLKLGDVSSIEKYFNKITKLDTNHFNKYLENVSQNSTETISDQLLNMLISDYYKNNPDSDGFSDYFKEDVDDNLEASYFERFIRSWVVFENAMTHVKFKNNVKHKKYFTLNLKGLLEFEQFTTEDVAKLTEIRQVRNKLLHGYEKLDEASLKKYFVALNSLTIKVVSLIEDEVIRNEIRKLIDNL